jgi:hypothetical protein
MSIFKIYSLRRDLRLTWLTPHYSLNIRKNFIGHVYVDDIICVSTNEGHCKEFGRLMSNKFKMSMIGDLTFCLDIQVANGGG